LPGSLANQGLTHASLVKDGKVLRKEQKGENKPRPAALEEAVLLDIYLEQLQNNVAALTAHGPRSCTLSCRTGFYVKIKRSEGVR